MFTTTTKGSPRSFLSWEPLPYNPAVENRPPTPDLVPRKLLFQVRPEGSWCVRILFEKGSRTASALLRAQLLALAPCRAAVRCCALRPIHELGVWKFRASTPPDSWNSLGPEGVSQKFRAGDSSSADSAKSTMGTPSPVHLQAPRTGVPRY